MPTNRVAVAAFLSVALLSVSAQAQKKYDPGASDTEIKLGQTMPYSGPLSGFITLAKAEIAYFAMINDQGGVNGRKINLISLDDGSSPPKTVEQTRKLIENDHVLAISGSLGTATNAAVQKYLNQKKVPQLFLATGANRWNDPRNFPYTMTLTPIYRAEASIYAAYVLKEVPNPKVAVLYQNDDFGKDFIKGFTDRLGDRAKSVMVRAVSYEVTDATVDSQMIDLASTKANVFLNITTPKFAVQAIRKASDIGWKPMQLIDNPAASVGIVMRPAGIEASKGIISAAFVKDPTDPQYRDDPEFKAWVAWMKKYYPAGSLEDPQNVVGYVQAQTMVQVLRQCGDNLTRENVMAQAANLRNFHPAMLLKGIEMNTSPTDYQPMEELLLQRFNGERFEVFGELLSARMK
ncbi:MAG: ABC transporter substrate-binding protein [Proteobacteria bacterium]|nr:ABC transporter substrate-binding protein [Pseudomonadota bacterium]